MNLKIVFIPLLAFEISIFIDNIRYALLLLCLIFLFNDYHVLQWRETYILSAKSRLSISQKHKNIRTPFRGFFFLFILPVNTAAA